MAQKGEVQKNLDGYWVDAEGVEISAHKIRAYVQSEIAANWPKAEGSGVGSSDIPPSIRSLNDALLPIAGGRIDTWAGVAGLDAPSWGMSGTKIVLLVADHHPEVYAYRILGHKQLDAVLIFHGHIPERVAHLPMVADPTEKSGERFIVFSGPRAHQLHAAFMQAAHLVPV